MKTRTQWLFEVPSNSFQHREWMDTYSSQSLKTDLEFEEAFDFESTGLLSATFDKIRDALVRGNEPLAVRLAILAGRKDKTDLTNMVFFARHPDRQGKRIETHEPNFQRLSQEWREIRDRIVSPALSQATQPSVIPSTGTTTCTATNTTNLRWGVPNGVIISPFHRNEQEHIQIMGRPPIKRKQHYGVDISGGGSGNKTVNDPRRGLPVYATIKPVISVDVLNSAKVRAVNRAGQFMTGLGIPGRGNAVLKNVLVDLPIWNTTVAPGNVISTWGGIVGLACRYAYTKNNGSPGVFTLYLEYLHLITEKFIPIDNRGNAMVRAEQWGQMGKCLGFGSRIKDKTILPASAFTNASPLLLGFLGATSTPHVHIHVNYAAGERGYQFFPRFDPTIVIT